MVDESARFPPEFDCVAEARRFVRRVLAGWGLERVGEPASLLVTELATNSVLHARTEFEVTVTFDGSTLRLGVSDGSLRPPSTKPHSREAATGRGLSLIVAVADSWSVEPHARGKTVWCVLAGENSTVLVDETETGAGTGQAFEGLLSLRNGGGRASDRPGGRRHLEDHLATSGRVA